MKLRIYATDTDAGTVSVINPEIEVGLVNTIVVGNAPRGAVKFTSNGRGYVSNCGGDTISEIDLLTEREIGKIQVGLAPRGIGIVPGDRFALVSNSGSNTVSIVDLNRRKEVYQIIVGRDPRHMGITPDGRFAFICIWGSQYVSKINIEELRDNNPNFEKVREVSQIYIGQNYYPYSLTLDSDKQVLYVANTQGHFMSVIDYSEDKIISHIDVGSKGGRAIALNADKSLAFLTIENTSEVVFIDTKSLQIVKRIPTGPGPRGILYNQQLDALYTAGFDRPSGGVGFLKYSETQSVTEIKLSKLWRDFKPSLVSEVDPSVEYRNLDGGKGCCSVSIVDLESTFPGIF